MDRTRSTRNRFLIWLFFILLWAGLGIWKGGYCWQIMWLGFGVGVFSELYGVLWYIEEAIRSSKEPDES